MLLRLFCLSARSKGYMESGGSSADTTRLLETDLTFPTSERMNEGNKRGPTNPAQVAQLESGIKTAPCASATGDSTAAVFNVMKRIANGESWSELSNEKTSSPIYASAMLNLPIISQHIVTMWSI